MSLASFGRPGSRRFTRDALVDLVVANAPLLLTVVLVVWIFLLNPRLLAPAQLEIKANALLSLVLLAVGETIVILAGGIDLSVAGVVSVANVVAATQMTNGNWPLVVVGLTIFGVTSGLINAAIIVGFRISPFMATLAMWSIWSGVADLILPFSGGAPASDFAALVRSKPAGIPSSVLVIAAIAIWWAWFKRTEAGMRIYAIGSDERAAFLSGIPVVRTKILAYGLAGLFAALAGIYRTVQIGSAEPSSGNGQLLPAVVAVVIGGASLAGGIGGAGMTILGVVIVLSISDLVFFLGVQTFYTPMFQGAFLIAAVALNVVASRRRIQRGVR